MRKRVETNRPIYRLVKDKILEDIAGGELHVGAFMPSERELSESMEVSRESVRRAFDDLEREGIIERPKNRRPVVLKDITSENKSSLRTVMIIAPSPLTRVFNQNPSFMTNIGTAIIQRLEDAGLNILFVNAGTLSENGDDIRELARGNYAGIFYWPLVGVWNTQIIGALEMAACPVMGLEMALKSDTIDTIEVDNYGGAVIATEFLVESGHEKIAMMTFSDEFHWLRDRRRGFQDAIANAKLDGKGGIVCVMDEHEARRPGPRCEEIIAKIADELRQRRFTACFAVSDEMGELVYKAAAIVGLSIPEDLSVVGFSNFLDLTPPLTSVSHMSMEIGRRAADIMLRKIESGGRGRIIFQEKVAPNLVVKSSVARLTVQERE